MCSVAENASQIRGSEDGLHVVSLRPISLETAAAHGVVWLGEHGVRHRWTCLSNPANRYSLGGGIPVAILSNFYFAVSGSCTSAAPRFYTREGSSPRSWIPGAAAFGLAPHAEQEKRGDGEDQNGA